MAEDADRGPASRKIGFFVVVALVGMLAGLPFAVWMDVSSLSQAALKRQAQDVSSLITSIRSYTPPMSSVAFSQHMRRATVPLRR